MLGSLNARVAECKGLKYDIVETKVVKSKGC